MLHPDCTKPDVAWQVLSLAVVCGKIWHDLLSWARPYLAEQAPPAVCGSSAVACSCLTACCAATTKPAAELAFIRVLLGIGALEKHWPLGPRVPSGCNMQHTRLQLDKLTSSHSYEVGQDSQAGLTLYKHL